MKHLQNDFYLCRARFYFISNKSSFLFFQYQQNIETKTAEYTRSRLPCLPQRTGQQSLDGLTSNIFDLRNIAWSQPVTFLHSRSSIGRRSYSIFCWQASLYSVQIWHICYYSPIPKGYEGKKYPECSWIWAKRSL